MASRRPESRERPLRILIVTPAPRGSRRGNRITALRQARFLRSMGHQVLLKERDDETVPADLLIALHARRSAAAVGSFKSRCPEAPVVLVLTGTDLYRDMREDAEAQASLRAATRIVVLQEHGLLMLPPGLRPRARVILQSVTPPGPLPTRERDRLQVCVLGHLRPVKDPFLVTRALELLPREIPLSVVHVGAALDPTMAARARDAMEADARYRWLGERRRSEALAILASSDVHVLTSRMEGGANAVCEAVACGVPTLSTRIGGSIGLLGETYPGFFEVGDASGLASLLERFTRDFAFRETLVSWTRDLAPRFAPERECRALAELLAELQPGFSGPTPAGPEHGKGRR